MKKLLILLLFTASLISAQSSSFFLLAMQETETVAVVDTIPDAFGFTDLLAVDLSTEYEAFVTLAGFDSGYAIPTGGDSLKIDGGTYTDDSLMVHSGDDLYVKLTSSASCNTDTDMIITIGGVADTFTVTTTNDKEPDPFTFAAVIDADLSTEYSDSIIVENMPCDTAIYAYDYDYRIGLNGSVVTAQGTVSNGDTV